MHIRPLTISSVWLCLILSQYGVFAAVPMTNSSPRGSVVNQQVGQPDCKRFRGTVECHVPVLDDNVDFRNYTGNIDWLEVYCDKKRYLPSRLLDGLFAPLGQTLEYISIHGCYIIDISSHAFAGLERLQTLLIEGECNSPMDKHWLEISNVSNSKQQFQTKLALPSTTWYSDNLVLPDGVFSELHNLSSLELRAMRLNNSVWHAVKHLGNLDYLDLSNNNITIIDINAINKLQKLEQLYLRDNYIQIIQNGTFESLSLLRYLYLPRNRIRLIEREIFKGLSQLGGLDLSGNSISTTDMGTFKGLSQLDWLDLSGNTISTIHKDTFKELSRLVSLYLSGNSISTIDMDTFKELSRLGRLDLSGNSISTINKDIFKGLSKLVSLDLSGNSISTINKDIFKGLSKLFSLDLSGNSISIIKMDTFKGLSKLVSLDLSGNSISTIHKDAFKELSLQYILDLSGNSISTIDMDTFKGLSKLGRLNLSGNSISTIHKDIFKGLSKLDILDLSVNSISTLEYGTFNGLTNLGHLFLAENRVRDEDILLLWALKSLRTLDLSHNLIETIPTLPDSIQSLVLKNNSIMVISIYSFSRLSYLTGLDLSYNDISKCTQYMFPYTLKELNLSSNVISVGSFYLTSQLRFADLRNNKLESLTISGLKKYRYARESGHIYLAGNGGPFRCICNIDNETTFSYDRSNVAQYHIWNFTSLNCMSVSENMQEPGITEIAASKFVCNTSCYDNCTCYHWRYRNDNINIVDCQGVGLAAVPRNISASFTILDLSGNMFPLLWPEIFDGLSELVELYLSSSNITEIREGSFRELSYLRKLDLSNNSIRCLDLGIFIGLSKLTSLDLSFNRLHVVIENTLKYFNRLKNLNLVGNELETISSSDIESMNTITSLKLSKDPWSCACQFLEIFKPFITENAKHIKDFFDIKCSALNKTEYYIYKIELAEFCPENDKTIYITKIDRTGYIIAGALLFGIICFGILFKNREFIKILCFVTCGWKPGNNELDRPYDAFISFSSKDDAFIVRELMPRLEQPLQNRPAYKLCVYFRDFPVGVCIANIILAAIGRSKRVIVILSDNFLTSEWCHYEFQAAHYQLLEEKKNRIIMVLLHDINTDLLDAKLKLFLRTRTYVKYGDPMFWNKIEYAMPKQKQPTEDNVNADNQIEDIVVGVDRIPDDDVPLLH